MQSDSTLSLWRDSVAPFTLLVGGLALLTLCGDYLLHRYDMVWIGRYLGIPGVLLIILSLIYSLRKRKRFASGGVRAWLTWHEFAAWSGSLMVLVHAGVHFNAILPWLATLAMGVNVISGLVGKMLLDRARKAMRNQREHYQLRGMSRQEVERALFWDAVVVDAMNKWRKVHIPIFVAFATLSLGHIISIFLFWGWS